MTNPCQRQLICLTLLSLAVLACGNRIAAHEPAWSDLGADDAILQQRKLLAAEHSHQVRLIRLDHSRRIQQLNQAHRDAAHLPPHRKHHQRDRIAQLRKAENQRFQQALSAHQYRYKQQLAEINHQLKLARLAPSPAVVWREDSHLPGPVCFQ
ncbi:MAG: hypothetical protein KDA60_11340 [Planctomycetales bacterium]|nr:hypothetical protein [Planctomycetales bacterium]